MREVSAQIKKDGKPIWLGFQQKTPLTEEEVRARVARGAPLYFGVPQGTKRDWEDRQAWTDFPHLYFDPDIITTLVQEKLIEFNMQIDGIAEFVAA